MSSGALTRPLPRWAMLGDMRSWTLGALLSLAVCTQAWAQSPGPELAEPAAAVATPVLSHIGLSLDVGIPDGATVSGLFRPADWVRLSAGLGYNFLSPGIRVGATFTPFHFLLTPSLTLEAGHYFVGDPGSKLDALVGSSGTAADNFRNVSYDFGNVHLGLEIGGKNFGGFLHVGMSYVNASVHDFQTLLQKNTNDPSLEAADPSLRFTVPSLKLGILYFFG